MGLFVLAVAVYANSLGHDFVWDDDPVILKNEFLAAPGAWWKCFGRDFGQEIVNRPVGYYRPLVFLSFILNHAIGGREPFVYHLSNVLLHGLITVLVFFLIRQMAGRLAGALTAALFAVHPIHAESVACVAGRSDLLCALFLLLSLLATTRSFERKAGARLAWQGVAVLTYAAALLSKELAIALPGVLLAHGLIRRYRWRNALRLCAPAIVVAVVYLGLRLLFMPMAGLGRSQVASNESLFARAAHLIFVYAAQQTFPVIPTLGAEVLARRQWVDAVAVVLLVLLLVAARPRGRALMAGIWLVFFLAPAFWVSLFAGIEQSDRFAYVPSIGVCALAAIVAAHAWERYKASRLVVVVILAAFAALSFHYSRMWHDRISLWSASVAYHPECGRCYYNLGNAYRKARNPTEAARNLRTATQLLPDDERRSWAWANLGDILAESGVDNLAIESYRHALALRPDRAHLRYSLATVLADSGDHAEAIAELDRALQDVPDHPLVHLELARECLAVAPPRLDRARTHYQRARQLGVPRDEAIEAALTPNPVEP